MANGGAASGAGYDDHEAKRRRRRKLVAYGGGGGVIIVVMIAIYFFFFSVVVYHTVQEALQEVQKRHPNADIKRDPSSGFVTAMANLESSTRKTEQIAQAAAGGFAKEFVQKPEVAMVLGVPKEAELRVTSTMADLQLSDYNIVRMQQFVDQVRLFGADIAVSVRSGPSASISTVTTRPPETVPAISLQPAIDEGTARAAAARHYASLAENPNRGLPKDAEVQESERVIFDPKRLGLPGEIALAWRMRLDAVQVFVDAKDAHIIVSYDDRHSVLNRITHDCKQTVNCPVVLNEVGPVPPITPLSTDAKGAHSAASSAHAYFKETFARDGFDDVLGTGGSLAIESYVQVFNFKNAQWVPNKRRFDFGVGWTTLDIAGHEYTHAVTSFGPGLIYFGESGAVNEFFSDFFGVMIERSVTNTLDWRIGEGLPGHSTARPLRNMADPHNGGFDKTKLYDPQTNAGQPHHFNEVVRTTDTICGAIGGDNGCVHFNSGILNKAMVLAIDGGTFQGTTVTPIARPKVEQIMFRTLMLGGVTSSSNLKDTGNGAVSSCGQLAQASQFGITAADCTTLARAFTAVGLSVTP